MELVETDFENFNTILTVRVDQETWYIYHNSLNAWLNVRAPTESIIITLGEEFDYKNRCIPTTMIEPVYTFYKEYKIIRPLLDTLGDTFALSMDYDDYNMYTVIIRLVPPDNTTLRSNTLSLYFNDWNGIYSIRIFNHHNPINTSFEVKESYKSKAALIADLKRVIDIYYNHIR